MNTSWQFHEREMVMKGLSLVFGQAVSAATANTRRNLRDVARSNLADASCVLDVMEKAEML